ncbi:MAG: CapA family protein [Ruminococcaceae bacterium]|nr:CapA family protein [Oscillospiraceae bacterium]
MKTLLLGDVCPSVVTADSFRKKDIDTLFSDVVPMMKESEFCFVNLECALTEADTKIKKFGPHLKAPSETAEILKELGVSVCGLSNNHIFDYGIDGAKDTIAVLNSVGLDYTGFGDDYGKSRKNYFYEKNGEKICVIAVCEHEFSGALENRMGSRTFEYDTFGDIIKAKKVADRVIVCYHGGKEFSRYPSPRLRKVCRAMADCGADVVLCQHSHCIGAYEKFGDTHILYGQGNFHFLYTIDMECWHTSLAVKYDTKSGEIEFVPLKETDNGIEIAKGDDGKEIMSAFEARNINLHNGVWLDEWHNFCIENKELYIDGIAKAGLDESTETDTKLFAQLLNCEAHNDVWCELYKTWNVTNCLDGE